MVSTSDLINYVSYKPSGIFSVSDVVYLYNTGQMAGPHGILAMGDNSQSQIGAGYAKATLGTGFVACSSDSTKPTWACATNTDNTAPYNKTAVIKADGKLYTRGSGGASFNTTGRSSNLDQLLPVDSSTNWTKVAMSLFGGLALKSTGALYSWGYNGYAGPGQGTVTGSTLTPTQVGTATNWSKIEACYTNGYGIQSDGTLWGWGNNDSYGMVGNGSLTGNVLTPTKIGTATNWSTIIGTQQGPIAMRSDGTVYRWGGSFGHASNISSTPVQVTGITNATKIGAAYDHAVILRSDGSVAAMGASFCWGVGVAAGGSTTTQPSFTNYIYSAPSTFTPATGGTIVDVKCAYQSTYYILSNGDVWFAGLGDTCPFFANGTAGTYYGLRYLFTIPNSGTLLVGDNQLLVWY